SIVGYLGESRYSQTATALESGKVLVAGGSDLETWAEGSSEVFDPYAEVAKSQILVRAAKLISKVGRTALSSPSCGTGRVALGGGVDVDANPALVSVSGSYPGPQGWKGEISIQPGGIAVLVRVWVVCATTPEDYVLVKSAPAPVVAGGSTSVAAAC